MRFAISATFVAVVLAGLAGGMPRPAAAAGTSHGSAAEQPLMVAKNSGPNLFALLQDIQRLQKQVRRLRGRVQMLEHQIDRNSQARQRMYQKLDKRLTALEKGGAGKADKQAIEKTYMAAFKKLRKGDYNGAIKGFESFVKKYPDNSYSDNAWYWLGQARYVQGKLSGAIDALQVVTSEYPKSNKMPSTLFRLGVIRSAQGQTDKARAAFEHVINDYPDSESAGMARSRLKDMKR